MATSLLPVLRRTLGQHKRYGQTQSTWLQGLRDKWIPVRVPRSQESQVCRAAAKILNGGAPSMKSLTEEQRIAVTMLAYQVWVDSVVADKPENEEHVANWMISAKKGHAMLALRNAAGGPETSGGPSGTGSPVSQKVARHVVRNFSLWGPLYTGLRARMRKAETS